jgi:hypothetical protein
MTMTMMSVITERTQWAGHIAAAWQKSVDSIIETARLLLAAKAAPEMQHGEWGTMVESDLPFALRTDQARRRHLRPKAATAPSSRTCSAKTQVAGPSKI